MKFSPLCECLEIYSMCVLVCNLVYLVKVQTYNDVGPLCLLINHLQEVNMADVCQEFVVKATTTYTVDMLFSQRS